MGIGLVPQLTGDGGLFKRLSIGGWGATAGEDAKMSMQSTETRESWGWFGGPGETASKVQASNTKFTKVSEPTSDTSPSPESYIAPLRSAISQSKFDAALVKRLISLRVQLSTAKMGWVEEFVRDDGGMKVFGELLRVIVDEMGRERDGTMKGRGRKSDGGEEVTVVLEVVKCLRVLLNTEVGHEVELNTYAVVLIIFLVAWI